VNYRGIFSAENTKPDIPAARAALVNAGVTNHVPSYQKRLLEILYFFKALVF
jgi:hypothetical protein